eukprot:2080810-Amphidinium_carterae.1
MADSRFLLKIEQKSQASDQIVHCSLDVESMFIQKCCETGELFKKSKKSIVWGTHGRSVAEHLSKSAPDNG